MNKIVSHILIGLIAALVAAAIMVFIFLKEFLGII